jgi:tetratricopeptide (TPR) repeat protein
LQDTTSLGSRSRHEFTEPDRELQSAIFQFRIKMDGLSKQFLDKYTDQSQYGPVFYFRGLIAFLDGDILTAHKMLSVSAKLTPFAETSQTETPRDFRIRAAFTRFYLALLEKNYGNMRTAKDYIEKSYRIYGQDEKSELLTLVTLAEILSYLPEGLEFARKDLEELFERFKLKVQTHRLTKAEAQYIPRAHLIYGNTFYVEKRWGEARTAYEKVLDINSKNYYAHHSLGQILQEEGRPQEAQATFDKAYQCLLDSRHLETKPERNTQIGLNALAYLCLRDIDRTAAKPYLDAVSSNLAKVRELNGFELKLFSLKKKRLITKDDFWSELLG